MTLAVHNVVQLSDTEVCNRFVVRQYELGELLVHLSEDDPPRHALVIGHRGMGKSLLMRRVAITVANDVDLACRWLPVVLPEELYEVTSIGELWLAALSQMATTLRDTDLAAQHDALRAELDPPRLETLALQRLLTAARTRGRKVLLLAENLDMLFGDQMGPDEGWALRQALQTENDLLLMATAVSTFAEVEESSEAFYGFFHRIDLRPLDDDDVRTLWRDVTDVDLADGRAAAIRILTGGNPRLTAVLGQFSQHPDLANLRQDLDLLIDEYTPYFKANIEVLPTAERKVFAALADIWAPATAAELALRVRMSSSQVSSLLGRLVRRGAVTVVGSDGGRKNYELTERLYNLYHLLRRPDSEGRVRALVDILTHLYGPDELERDVLRGIVQQRPTAPPLSDLDTRIASFLSRYIDVAGVWEALSPNQLEARLPVLESLLQSQRASLGDTHPDTLLTRQQIAFFSIAGGEIVAGLRLYAAVLADQEHSLGVNHRDTLTSRAQVAYCTGATGDPAAALELYREVAADRERVLGPDDRDTLRSRHQLAYYTGETGDASVALEVIRDVVRRAERTLAAEDGLLRAAQWLHGKLELQMLARSEKPLPRELRELLGLRSDGPGGRQA